MADLTLVQGLKPQQRGLANLMQGFEDGLGIRDKINQRKDAKLMNQILSIGNDQDQIAAARASGRAGTLLPKIQEQQAARLKADMDRQKTQAEIGKIGAESGKFGADVKKTEFEINQGRVKAVTDAVGGLTAMGDKITKTAVLQQLMGLTNLGVLTPDQAMSEYNAMPDDPMQLQQYVQSKMPIGEQTTRRGQDMTQETALRGQDMTQETAMYGQDAQTGRTQATLTAQSQRLAQQQQRGQVIKGADGYFVVDPMTGQAVPVTADGQQVRVANKFAEKPEDRMDRLNNANKSAAATASAARASKAAQDLMNHPGLNAGTGSLSQLGMIPGTKAHAFQTDLENLKSQLFLPMVQQLKGMGALSNAEGERLTAAVENLVYTVDGAEMRKRLQAVQDLMAGVAEVSKNETLIYASRGNPAEINRLIGESRAARQGGQTQQPPAQVTITRAQAQTAAEQAGVSMEQAIAAYRAKGIEVR